MMKRIIALMLSLMLALGVMLALASCGDTTPTGECTEHKDSDGDGICDTEGCDAAVEPDAAPESGYFNENGELYLFKDGAPTFQFVMGGDALTANRNEIEELAEQLTSLGSSEVKYVAQNDDAQDVEILIGTVTNRGDEYKLNKYDFGVKGYAVKQVGTKILVIGGSNASTSSAINYLKENVFKIKKNNEKFTDFVMEKDANYEYRQSGYKITSVHIDGTPLSEFTIAYPSGDSIAGDIASSIQTKLYTDAGIWCEVKAEKLATGKKLIIRSIDNDGEGGGFYANVTDGNLVVECELGDKFTDLFNQFADDYIFKKRGAVSFASDFKYEPDHRTITYEQYGANGSDTLDDFAAIKAAHDDANKYLLKVKANDNATYYLTKKSEENFITVKTDTYWGKANFIIVDSDLTTEDPARKVDIFKIASENELTRYYPTGSSDISKLLSEINANGGIKKEEFTTFDLGLGRDALVYIVNTNHKNYVRFGTNKNTGENQREFVYVNADGTIASDTGLLFDYTEITYIEVMFVDDRPITIDGGIFTTIANQLPCNYTWYTERGILINRSNTTVQNLEHYITGEGDIGAPYSGFLTISECTDVTIKDTVLTAHKAYGLEGATDGNTMGTYDLSPSNCNRLHVLRVTQSNFFEEDGVTTTKIGAGGFWGIMGSNRCKNIVYEESTLSRFDAHQGTLNARIIKSKVGSITLIGGGEFELIGSEVYSQGSSLITLRDDYGSTWCGNMLIKDTVMMLPKDSTRNNISIITAYWNESELNSPGDKSMCDGPHDFGYDCYLPKSVILDGFTVSSSSVKYIYLMNGTAYSTHSGNTVNKHYVTEYYEIKNSDKRYTYNDPRDYFKKLTFVIDGVEK